MLKYFLQHLTKFFMPRDSFSETTVTLNDPLSEIFNYFQNIIITFLEKGFFNKRFLLGLNSFLFKAKTYILIRSINLN